MKYATQAQKLARVLNLGTFACIPKHQLIEEETEFRRSNNPAIFVDTLEEAIADIEDNFNKGFKLYRFDLHNSTSDRICQWTMNPFSLIDIVILFNSK